MGLDGDGAKCPTDEVSEQTKAEWHHTDQHVQQEEAGCVGRTHYTVLGRLA